MMKQRVWACGAVAAICLSASINAGTQDAAKEQLRIALKDSEVKGSWFYDDLSAGTAAAKKSGLPMLIVFR